MAEKFRLIVAVQAEIALYRSEGYAHATHILPFCFIFSCCPFFKHQHLASQFQKISNDLFYFIKRLN
jgi:hypothetical protein